MTITPTAPAPVTGTTSAPAGSGAASDGGFGALLAQLAAPSPETAAKLVEPAAEGEVVDPEPAVLAPLVGATPAADVVPTAPAGSAAPVAAGPGLAETAVRGVAGIAPDGTAATTATLGGAAGALGQVPEDALPAGVQTVAPAAQAAPAAPAGGATSSVVEALVAAADQLVDAQGGEPAAVPADVEEALSALVPAGSAETGADGHPTGQQSTTNAVVTAAGATTAAAAVPSVADAGQVTPSRLLEQVTPVVTRMVSAGEGSHRMVLRLHPADLGEVHLTVTVRGESVDVTVAAGSEARGLLASGSSELRALLDSVGRSVGQITFKDLPGATQLPPPATGLPTTGSDSGQPGTPYAGADADRDGGAAEGRGQGAQRSGPDHQAGRPADPLDRTTPPTRSPGSGALDVTI